MIAKSSQRVASSTDPKLNEEIRRQTEMRIAYYAQHPEEVAARLHELDEEWDVERVLEVNASALTITGILLSFVRGKKWLLMSAAVQGFFLQHALQGWCPPLPILRKLGIRTQREIDEERFGLMRLREEGSKGSKSKSSSHDAVTR